MGKRRSTAASRRKTPRISDPEREAAIALGTKRARGVIRARKALAPEEARTGVNGLLVAEGDSWFDYPLYDVLQELDRRFNYRIESVSHKGDTVEEMAYGDGQLARLAAMLEGLGLRDDRPRAILISGGGNDIAGDEFATLLNHKRSGLPALNDEVVNGIVRGRLSVAIMSLLGAVTELSQHYLGRVVPILVHGYGHAVADGRGYLGGISFLPGPWLEPGFRRKGYQDMAERVHVVADLIDRFNGMLRAVAGAPALKHVSYVDVRSVLSNELAGRRYRQSWENELHPTRAGFVRVAERFHKTISRLPMP